MRGKEYVNRPPRVHLGITPACAGKRLVPSAPLDKGGDHPRMCGEKAASGEYVTRKEGSPPHVRGKGLQFAVSCRDLGITPACAGKRAQREGTPCGTGDHPRMCGEKGFPPGLCVLLTRITPACAGKRLKRSRSIVPHAAIVPLFPSVCNKPAGSDGSPAGHDAPPFLPIENAAPASPAYNLRSL